MRSFFTAIALVSATNAVLLTQDPQLEELLRFVGWSLSHFDKISDELIKEMNGQSTSADSAYKALITTHNVQEAVDMLGDSCKAYATDAEGVTLDQLKACLTAFYQHHKGAFHPMPALPQMLKEIDWQNYIRILSNWHPSSVTGQLNEYNTVRDLIVADFTMEDRDYGNHDGMISVTEILALFEWSSETKRFTTDQKTEVAHWIQHCKNNEDAIGVTYQELKDCLDANQDYLKQTF